MSRPMIKGGHVLKGGFWPEPVRVLTARQLGAEGEPPPSEEAVIAFAVGEVLSAYRAEVLAGRRRDAEIKRKYGLRSLEQLILETEARLIDYETRRAQGNPIPEAEIAREQRHQEELEERRRRLEEEIRRETSLLPSAPRVIAVVRVVPQADADPEVRSDAQIEAIGMRVAMAYERHQGRTPEDVSAQNLGYDIRSTGPENQLRYIEVKARARTGSIVLTPNEWFMARRLGDQYWLYVVESAAAEPVLYTIQNPASKLRPQQVVEIVRFVVKDWRAHAVRTREGPGG